MISETQPTLDTALDTLRRDTILALVTQTKDILSVVQDRYREHYDLQSARMITEVFKRLDTIFDTASTL